MNVGSSEGKTKNRSDALVVLGMHRSGTSALTRLLSMTGAYLPVQTPTLEENQDRGYWQSEYLVKFNERLLAELDSHWFDWRPVDLKTLSFEKRRMFQQDLQDFLVKEYPSDKPIVIEEPRLCRIAKFFLSAAGEVGYQPRVIIAFRNPLEVIDSLMTRSAQWPADYDHIDAALLWLVHVLNAESASRAFPRAFSSHEQLIKTPADSLERIIKQVAYAPPVSLDSMKKDINHIIKADIRHPAQMLDAVYIDRQLAGWIGTAYKALRDLEAGRRIGDAEQTLDQVHQEFSNALPILMQTTEARRSAQRLHAAAEVKANEAVARAENAEIQQQNLTREMALLRQSSEKREGVLGSEIAELKGAMERIPPDWRQRLKKLDKALLKIETLEKKLAKDQAERDELDRQTQILEKQLSIEKSNTTALTERIAEIDAQISDYAVALKQSDDASGETIRDLEALVRAKEFENNNLKSQLQTNEVLLTANRAETPKGPITRIIERLLRTLNVQEQITTRKHAQLIKTSSLFNKDWYLENYPDILDSRIDPVDHYLRHGYLEGRNPSADFDGVAYLKQYKDVVDKKWNPLVHFLIFGRKEGRTAGLTASSYAESMDQPTASTYIPTEQHIHQNLLEAVKNSTKYKISLVIPIYKTPKTLFRALIGSILDQTFPAHEIILVDDSGETGFAAPYLSEMGIENEAFKVIHSGVNHGISEATNEGLRHVTGDFIAFVDHDDEMTPDALLFVAYNILKNPEMDVWYSDQITVDKDGAMLHHFLKPDWSPTYFKGAMYLGHLLVVRASLAKRIMFDPAFDGVQDFEFALRLTEETGKIGHISRVLYKWRAIEGSVALDGGEKSNIDELQQLAVQKHLINKGLSWRAVSHGKIQHRISLKPGPRTPTPSISIIIPTKDQSAVVTRCLESIFNITDYPDFEVIIVDTGTTEHKALSTFERLPVKRIKQFEGVFNYSHANNEGVRQAGGDYLVFLNNDTEVLEADWLHSMVMFFEDDEIGAVGTKLIYPDQSIQHAGVVLGPRGTADHVMRRFPKDIDGYGGSLSVTREVSAVTAACMMVPRALFDSIGGFSTDYAKHYQDVDLCCRIIETGKRIVSIGSTTLVHHESISRKRDGYDLGDRALLIDRWGPVIQQGDPYFNEGFAKEKVDYSVDLILV